MYTSYNIERRFQFISFLQVYIHFSELTVT